MIPVVVSSAALPFDIAPLLGPQGSVRFFAPPAGSLSRTELLQALIDADALISLLTVAVDQELFAAAPRLKVVANFAVGFDNIDVAEATRRRVVVTNTPAVLTEATADFTFALLLAVARRVIEGDRFVRSGTWAGWEPGQLLGAQVAGQTLGIIGMGRIGQAVARRGRGFAMHIVYAGARPHPQEERLLTELGARQVGLDELLATSDFVSLHCPLTAATRHIIGEDALRIMKPSAILLNTARGGCIDEDALVRALAAGQIAGAGLDVYAAEPVVHPGLMDSEGRAGGRVVLAPHAGSATVGARRRMAEMCASAVAAVLGGKRPPHVINPEVYR